MESPATPPPIEITPEYRKNQRKRNIKWIVAFALFFTCACGGVVVATIAVLPSLIVARFPVKNVSCAKNMKEVANGLLLYANDHDDTLPPSKVWVDTSIAYVKDPNFYKCPAVKTSSFGFALNDWLGATRISQVADAGKTILLFEPQSPKINASGDPRKDAANPPRHEGVNHQAFLSGEVEASAQVADRSAD